MEYIESEKIKNTPSLYRDIGESHSWILREKFIFRFLEKISKEVNILDIGCGNGYFLDRLKESGFMNLYGVDLANFLANKSHKHRVVDINVEKLPFENKSFDVIIATQVLEHLENYFLILQETERVLKKGGYFIFAIPNQFNIFAKIKFLFSGNVTRWNLKNNHLLFLTKDVFRKTYLNNFEIVDIYYDKGPLPVFRRLKIPVINRKMKFKIITWKPRFFPRCELLSDGVCYILKKKT